MATRPDAALPFMAVGRTVARELVGAARVATACRRSREADTRIFALGACACPRAVRDQRHLAPELHACQPPAFAQAARNAHGG